MENDSTDETTLDTLAYKDSELAIDGNKCNVRVNQKGWIVARLQL